MTIFPIGSSSSGNLTLVENATTRIIIDAGIALKYVKPHIPSASAILISHTHSDHVKNLDRLWLHYKAPIYASYWTLNERADIFEGLETKELSYKTNNIGDFTVVAFPTLHDAPNVGFFLTDNLSGLSLCFITDTGKTNKGLQRIAAKADILMIEADYDEWGLRDYPGYPDSVKARIRSRWGHLSNQQVVTFLRELVDQGKEFRQVIFTHMSPRTNSPEYLMDMINDDLPELIGKVIVAPTTAPLRFSNSE